MVVVVPYQFRTTPSSEPPGPNKHAPSPWGSGPGFILTWALSPSFSWLTPSLPTLLLHSVESSFMVRYLPRRGLASLHIPLLYNTPKALLNVSHMRDKEKGKKKLSKSWPCRVLDIEELGASMDYIDPCHRVVDLYRDFVTLGATTPLGGIIALYVCPSLKTPRSQDPKKPDMVYNAK